MMIFWECIKFNDTFILNLKMWSGGKVAWKNLLILIVCTLKLILRDSIIIIISNFMWCLLKSAVNWLDITRSKSSTILVHRLNYTYQLSSLSLSLYPNTAVYNMHYILLFHLIAMHTSLRSACCVTWLPIFYFTHSSRN